MSELLDFPSSSIHPFHFAGPVFAVDIFLIVTNGVRDVADFFVEVSYVVICVVVIRVNANGLLIMLNGLRWHSHSGICVRQVVVIVRIVWFQPDGNMICLDGFIILSLCKEDVCEIIMCTWIIRVELYAFLIMLCGQAISFRGQIFIIAILGHIA